MCFHPEHPLRHLLLLSHLLAAYDLYDPGLLSGLQVPPTSKLEIHFLSCQGSSKAEECDGDDNKHPSTSNKRRQQVIVIWMFLDSRCRFEV